MIYDLSGDDTVFVPHATEPMLVDVTYGIEALSLTRNFYLASYLRSDEIGDELPEINIYQAMRIPFRANLCRVSIPGLHSGLIVEEAIEMQPGSLVLRILDGIADPGEAPWIAVSPDQEVDMGLYRIEIHRMIDQRRYSTLPETAVPSRIHCDDALMLVERGPWIDGSQQAAQVCDIQALQMLGLDVA